MTPRQLVRQRLTFWKSQIQFAHVYKVRATKAFSPKTCKVFCKISYQLIAIFSFSVTTLLELHYILPCLPVCIKQFRVDSNRGLCFRILPKIWDKRDKSHIFGIIIRKLTYRAYWGIIHISISFVHKTINLSISTNIMLFRKIKTERIWIFTYAPISIPAWE